MPAAAVAAPIVVPSMLPPLISTFGIAVVPAPVIVRVPVLTPVVVSSPVLGTKLNFEDETLNLLVPPEETVDSVG